MAEEFVRSLARGLEVICAFDAEHPSQTLSEVAVRTGLGRATARRFLHTLVELGYVRFDGRCFALTPQVLRLGTAYLSGLDLAQVAQPHLERLSAQLGESTSAAVLDGTEIVYVARVATRRIMSVGITVGTRFPATATSMGRVLLAGLDEEGLDAVLGAAPSPGRTPWSVTDPDALREVVAEVRDQGWAYVDQELEVGLRSLAVPVRGRSGEVVAALNVSSSTPIDDLAEVVAALRDVVARVEADLRLTSH